MKRVNLNNSKMEQPHFIGSWNIENNTLCEEIISFFEENQNLQKSGFTGSGVKPTLKKTTDITISGSWSIIGMFIFKLIVKISILAFYARMPNDFNTSIIYFT